MRRRRRAHRGAVAEGARRVWRGVGGYGEGTERAERTLGSEGARVRVTLNNGGNGVWSTGTPKFLKPLFDTPFSAYNSTLGVAVHCSAAGRKAAIPAPIVTLYSGRAGSCPRATHERGGQACTLVGLRVCALWFL